MSGDQAKVTVSVAVDPAEAFRVFTSEIDRWWRRGPKYRHLINAGSSIHIESGVGGRVFERPGVADNAALFEIGRIRAWNPPHRFVFSWRNANFAAGEYTEVEVCFSPITAGTSVTVIHRGWAALPSDHPARHGRGGAEFVREKGLWWGEQLSALRAYAANREPERGRS